VIDGQILVQRSDLLANEREERLSVPPRLQSDGHMRTNRVWIQEIDLAANLIRQRVVLQVFHDADYLRGVANKIPVLNVDQFSDSVLPWPGFLCTVSSVMASLRFSATS